MLSGDDEEEGDEEGDEEEMPAMDMDAEEEPEEESFNFEATKEEDEDDKVEESNKSQTETMREYVEKINATMGDNGANTKSTVAGKNDMGGTTANLGGGESNGEGTKGGLADPSSKEDNAGNVNVPGAKGASKLASKPGHGAEKKGKPENAGDKGSMLNGAPKRAK
jgi:hypothetical protein